MRFKVIIPPTGEEYISTDLNSVRAYFIRAYKQLAREHRIDMETELCADVYIYTPKHGYAAIGAMSWVTPAISEQYIGIKTGAYWCDYADTDGEITYSRKVTVSGIVHYNNDYDARFTQ